MQKLNAGTHQVVEKRLTLIIECSNRDGSTSLGSFSAHSTNHESQQTGARADSECRCVATSGTAQSSASVFRGGADPRDNSLWY